MLTLMETGSDSSITGTAVHEWMHNWYYGMMGNNENDEHWLDEGFASYATSDILGHVIPASARQLRQASYDQVLQSGPQITDPVSTPANHFSKNLWYFFNAYAKPEAFLWQLRYIVGDEAFKRGMLRYHAEWQFKHPTGDDFIRSMERTSGMELDWYYAGWIKTLHSIDYGTETPLPDGSSASKVILRNHGTLPMPVEVLIEFKDGSSELHYIPLDLQYGAKKFLAGTTVVTREPWSFSVDTYEIRLEKPVTGIKSITIDPDNWTADMNRGNNKWAF